VSKADLEELNSQWARKNVDLSSVIEDLKVSCTELLLLTLLLPQVHRSITKRNSHY